MSLMLGISAGLGVGLLYTGTKMLKYKEKASKAVENCQRESLYGKIYPIKRVLLRYHKLMEPHEFFDVAHQQARFRGIKGAIGTSERLIDLLKNELNEIELERQEVISRTSVFYLLGYHNGFLTALSERNSIVKAKLQEIPKPSHRPPSPNDLERKMGYLRDALDDYDNCLYKFDVEKCLAEMREIMEILRFYAPDILVKPVIWEALIRSEHFLVELVNLLPENLQKGIRTDAVMLEAAG